MKIKIKKKINTHLQYIYIVVFTTLVFNKSHIKAQVITRSVISSFGGSSTFGSLYISQTGGQPGNTTQTKNENTTLNQGFEQNLGKVIETKPIILQLIKVYPNPNNGEFTLSVNNVSSKTFDFIIFDNFGREVLANKGYVNFNTLINLKGMLSEGTYFIKIINNNEISAAHKIIIINN